MRVGHRNGACAVLRSPLMRTGGALGELPFVAEQVLEKIAAPPRRGSGPGDFQPAGNRVLAFARAESAPPAETLLLDGGGFGLRAHERGIARAVGLAEGMPAGNQCDRFLV